MESSEPSLVNKIKILRNPSKKSARDLLKAINKPGYEVGIKNREGGDGVIVRIDKKQVPMSLNGKKKHLLFICSGAIDRSPCAARLFDNSKEYLAKFAGVGPLTENPVTKDLIDWADVIFCMEEEHKHLLFEQIPEARNKEIKVLDIPNTYLRYNPELTKLLKVKLLDYVKL